MRQYFRKLLKRSSSVPRVAIAGRCRPRLTAAYRQTRNQHFATWRKVTGAAA